MATLISLLLHQGSSFTSHSMLSVSRSVRWKSMSPQRSSRLIVMVSTDKNEVKEKTSMKGGGIQGMGVAGIASAAVVAASAINDAVGMRGIAAPDVTSKSFVFTEGAAKNRTGLVDEVGLPLVYDKDLIQAYWKSQNGALTRRWSEFLGYAVPFLTRVFTIVIAQGSGALKDEASSLAKDARERMQSLGPTYVKLGQMMSVRPDVLPESALKELRILQDSVEAFETDIAIAQIESELNGPLGQFFSSISKEPVAAASLAQVYRAVRVDTEEVVAIKVQRPSVLETVSKDLYVLRRAAEVYQGLMDRFAPQQRTNYVALLNEWAVGFYTELDFLNEAANQQKVRDALLEHGVTGVYVPTVHHDLCTRRILVTEWVDGTKLSDCDAPKIKELIGDAQEAFLFQLLQIGFLHADPHPGNLLYLKEPREMPDGNIAKMALIDFGLVARVNGKDIDTMVKCIIHLANKDYASLVDDFIDLEILPEDCNRQKVVPLMDKALTPYVKGGGAKKYEEELMKIYGVEGNSMSSTAKGFSAMTQDALVVLNDIPFSIPPYFALLGRAIVTLEGIALTGDPDYGIIMEAYPFVARKLLKEDRPELQKALQEVLYAKDGSGEDGMLKTTRLSVLLNSALGVISRNKGGAFIDFDTLPEDAVSLEQTLQFLLSPQSENLRKLLVDEAVIAGDILLRQALRKSFSTVTSRVPSIPILFNFLPKIQDIPVPFLIPSMQVVEEGRDFLSEIDLSSLSLNTLGQISASVNSQDYSTVITTSQDLVSAAAPKLSLEEEFYALSLTDVAKESFGEDFAAIINGDTLTEPRSMVRVLLKFVNGGTITLPENVKTALRTFVSSSFASNVIGIQAQDIFQSETPLPNAHSADKLNNLTSAFNSLSTEETEMLNKFLRDINIRLRTRLVDRLQHLKK